MSHRQRYLPGWTATRGISSLTASGEAWIVVTKSGKCHAVADHSEAGLNERTGQPYREIVTACDMVLEFDGHPHTIGHYSIPELRNSGDKQLCLSCQRTWQGYVDSLESDPHLGDRGLQL